MAPSLEIRGPLVDVEFRHETKAPYSINYHYFQILIRYALQVTMYTSSNHSSFDDVTVAFAIGTCYFSVFLEIFFIFWLHLFSLSTCASSVIIALCISRGSLGTKKGGACGHYAPCAIMPLCFYLLPFTFLTLFLIHFAFSRLMISFFSERCIAWHGMA